MQFGATRLAVIPLLLVLLLGAPLPASAASPSEGPEGFLPADLAVVLVVEHPQEAAREWPRTPLGVLLGDPDLVPRLSGHPVPTDPDSAAAERRRAFPGDLEAKVREATGRSLADLCAGVEGPLVFVLDDLAPLFSGRAGGEPPHWGILVRGMDPGLYEDMAASLRARRTDTADPERFPAWVEAGPWRILATPGSYLHELAASAAAGTVEAPLSASSAYRALREEHPDADVYLALNISGVAPAMRKGIETELEKTPEPRAMGLDPAAVVDALGLDAVDGLTVAARFRPEETRIDQAFLIKENRGLVKLMAYLPGPCLRPAFIPENAAMAWTDRFDASATYHALVEIVEAVSPGFGALAETQLRQIALSAGVEMERDILERIGPDGFAVYLPPAAPSDGGERMLQSLPQVVGCVSSDPQALVDALLRIAASVSPDSSRAWTSHNVGGTVVHTLGAPAGAAGAPGGVSYAVTDDLVLFAHGDPAALEAVLRARTGRGKGLWGRPDLAGAFASIPETSSMIGYADLGALLGRPHDLGPMVSSMVRTERGFFSVVRILPPRR